MCPKSINDFTPPTLTVQLVCKVDKYSQKYFNCHFYWWVESLRSSNSLKVSTLLIVLIIISKHGWVWVAKYWNSLPIKVWPWLYFPPIKPDLRRSTCKLVINLSFGQNWSIIKAADKEPSVNVMFGEWTNMKQKIFFCKFEDSIKFQIVSPFNGRLNIKWLMTNLTRQVKFNKF